jgi:uncharacterized protein YndB with AHSA1/START domain
MYDASSGDRIDLATRVMASPSARIFAALLDPTALVAWLPPAGMSGRFDEFDPRPGGGYRMVLTYERAEHAGSGKYSATEDLVDVRFVEIVPGERVVQAVDFDAADAAFAGTMTMTWRVEPEGEGTRVTFEARDVPPGISPEDHLAGFSASLAQLAAYVEGSESNRQRPSSPPK